MQSSFQQLLHMLRAAESDQDILDVKAPRWFEDFAKFKAGVRDLEVMFCTVIQQAFDSTTSLLAQLTLLEVTSCSLDHDMAWPPSLCSSPSEES